jgi:hypothetical protein
MKIKIQKWMDLTYKVGWDAQLCHTKLTTVLIENNDEKE